jgi:transposase
MQARAIESFRKAHEADALSREQVGALIDAVDRLSQRVEWFEKQLFGHKSEKRLPPADPLQGTLGESFEAILTDGPKPAKVKIEAHERVHKSKAGVAEGEDTQAFFDEGKVPVETIEVPNPALAGLAPEQYEVVGQKVTHRLAQRPGSYVVLRYVRTVIKLREAGPADGSKLVCPPAPVGVIEGSRADVSLLAGMIVDKFDYHLPLYRQHRRLQAAGLRVSRQWLTQLMQRAVGLLEPIYDAQIAGVLTDRVKAMDETPIKAAGAGSGKMKTAYFWPVYGQNDEVCFFYYPDRAAKNVADALGLRPPQGAVLLTDGYAAYAHYARKVGLTHAQCWAHTRRTFFEAQAVEPQRAAHALQMIGTLYEVEAEIKQRGLEGGAKRALRQQKAASQVKDFLAWVDEQFESQGLLPSSPLTKALAYTRERREGLQVYLADADVPIDTNHLERALRAIPMGRKNWLFCWTEVGAQHVATVQSLLVTCRLHDIDPYEYFVDVLQRVGQHPASRVSELTPRNWKRLYAANPLRSPLYQINHALKNAA